MSASAVAVALALVLTGCMSPGGEPAAPSSGTALSGTIRVAAAGGEGEIKAVQRVAAAFTAGHTGTKVELDTVAEAGELISKLTTEFVAGDQPDVFVLNYRRLGGFAAKGVIEPVPSAASDGLYPKPLEAFTFDGQLLCRPSNASSMVVYINTTLFDRAGVPLPIKDWTWDDLLSTATALKAKGIPAIGFETLLIRLAPFVWSNGGEVVDDLDAPTMVDLSSPEARAAMAFMLDLQKQGLSATDRAAQDPEEAFAAGRTAMHLDSRRAVPGFRKTAGLSFDVAQVPTKKTATSVLHSDGYCVTKGSKNKALAQAFADFAVNGEGATLLAEAGRTVPVRKAVAESAAFLAPDKAPKSSRVFLDQLELARPLPHSATWNEAEGATDEILTQLFAGKTTLDKAILDIAAETKRKLVAS